MIYLAAVVQKVDSTILWIKPYSYQLDSDLSSLLIAPVGTLSKDDEDVSENVAKKMNLSSFKLNRVYLDPLNMSNAGDFSWS